MEETFQLEVGSPELHFCAAHFITYAGGSREPLHGHDYRVRVRMQGTADEEAMVHDFVDLREKTRGLLEPLDHRTLLPGRSPHLEVRREGDAVTVGPRGGGREVYRFPASAVVVLPVPNTTAEMLASHLADALLEELAPGAGDNVRRVEVEVEESPGQSAACCREL